MGSLVSLSGAVVADSETVSSAVALGGNSVVAFIIPDNVDSTAATFEMAMDDASGLAAGTWHRVVDADGLPFEITFIENDWVSVDHDALSGARWLRIVMGTTESPAKTVGVVLQSQS